MDVDHYISLLDAIPAPLYWLDQDGQLKGCNQAFAQWMQIPANVSDHYKVLAQTNGWTIQTLELFKLDDLQVLFSRKPSYNQRIYGSDIGSNMPVYMVSRIPLFNMQKICSGLLVYFQLGALIKDSAQEISIDTTELTVSCPQAVNHPYILIVEDNKIAQKITKELFVTLNCHVDVASSGDEAIQLFKSNEYHLILMDIELQETSGYVISKKIRQIEQAKPDVKVTPILALTAYKATIVKYDCEDYLMNGVITKPLTTQQAKQIIARYIYNEDTQVEHLQCVEIEE